MAFCKISNLFQPSVANSLIGNFWYMFTAVPASLLSELIFESKAQYQKWKFKCLSFYIHLSAALNENDNLWATYSRLKKRKPEETNDDLLKQVMHLYFEWITSMSSEWQNWDISKLDKELQRLWSMYLFLISFHKESNLVTLIQRIMEKLFHVLCKNGNENYTLSVFAYCSEKWPELDKNRKRRRER